MVGWGDLYGRQTLEQILQDFDYSYIIYKYGSSYIAESGNSVTPIYYDSGASYETVIQNIINNVPNGTPTLILSGAGDFIQNGLWNVPASKLGNIWYKGMGTGITRINMASGLDALGTNYAIQIGERGSQVAGNTGTLTVNANVKDTVLTMSSADAGKFTAGDYVLLESSDIFSAQPSGGARSAEVYRVKSVNSGAGTVTLLTPVVQAHTTANTALLIKLSILDNMKFSDLTIKKHSSLTSTTINFFKAVHCIIQLSNVELIDNVAQFQSGIVLESCISSNARNIKLVQTAGNSSNNQYGIVAYGHCTDVLVADSRAYGSFRHPFEIGDGITGSDPMVAGQGRGLECANCMQIGANTGGFDNHADAVSPIFTNCISLGTDAGGHGFEMRCTSPKLINCHAFNSQSQAFDLSEDANFTQISNPSVKNCASTGIRIRGVTDVQIEGGEITTCTLDGVLADAGSDRLSITRLKAHDNTLTGIKFTDTDGAKINHNDCINNGSYGIDIDATIDVSKNDVSHNTTTGNTTGQIRTTSHVLGTCIIKDNIGYNTIGDFREPVGSPLYLFPHRMSYMNSITNRAELVSGDVNIFAFYTEKKITITRFQFQIATLGTAGTKMRLGIYQSASQTQPTPDTGALLWDSGDLPADATGLKDIALTSGTPASNVTVQGWFFACFTCNDTVLFRYVGATGNGMIANIGSSKVAGCIYAQAYGAFANPCPATTASPASNANCSLVFNT